MTQSCPAALLLSRLLPERGPSPDCWEELVLMAYAEVVTVPLALTGTL